MNLLNNKNYRVVKKEKTINIKNKIENKSIKKLPRRYFIISLIPLLIYMYYFPYVLLIILIFLIIVYTIVIIIEWLINKYL